MRKEADKVALSFPLMRGRVSSWYSWWLADMTTGATHTSNTEAELPILGGKGVGRGEREQRGKGAERKGSREGSEQRGKGAERKVSIEERN